MLARCASVQTATLVSRGGAVAPDNTADDCRIAVPEAGDSASFRVRGITVIVQFWTVALPLTTCIPSAELSRCVSDYEAIQKQRIEASRKADSTSPVDRIAVFQNAVLDDWRAFLAIDRPAIVGVVPVGDCEAIEHRLRSHVRIEYEAASGVLAVDDGGHRPFSDSRL